MPFTIIFRTYDPKVRKVVNRVHDCQTNDRDEAVAVAQHLSRDFTDTYVHVLDPEGWQAYRFLNGAFA